ncbi:DUF5722 domain-containing protein [Butyrivibrio sp. NC3005]|uniref:DUF5722 domain-containing protein n=1 Tax=Butyrivibrio sp. NC3005 TaxID=1280685 RepID=UPI000410CFEA|nr:DUF5722 domain-containing protein [Butyrivibrio sp. NC3005]
MKDSKRIVFLRKIVALIVGATLCICAMDNMSSFTLKTKAAGNVISLTASIAGKNVVIKANVGTVPSNSDGQYHLYAQDVFESGTMGKQVATQAAAKTATFTVPLAKNSAGSMLYKKFVVLVNQNGNLVPASNAAYITNPEGCATHTVARMNVGKKGIIPASAKLGDNGLKELGVHQVSYNLLVSHMMNTSQGQITYNYNGKTYHFSKGLIGAYDNLMNWFKSSNVQVTLIILNDWQNNQVTIHPWSRAGAGAYYYAFNAADGDGTGYLAAIGSFLASRYAGKVDNFIIGNEINARQEWNYMSPVDVNTYAVQTANAFRVFYNAIKSENGNAKVYLPLDQQWASSSSAAKYYSGLSYLNAFNSYISAEGNIDWDLAFHPYNVPLTSPYSWANSAKYVNHTINTRFIAMQNIDVLTDYMGSPQFLNPKGQIRSVLCSEVGYTSSAGEAVQAASIVYAYQQAAANQHIDGFILNRQMDDATEIAQGLATGLMQTNGAHKMSFDYYKNIDTANGQQYINAASSIIGADLNSLLIRR